MSANQSNCGPWGKPCVRAAGGTYEVVRFRKAENPRLRSEVLARCRYAQHAALLIDALKTEGPKA